MFSLTGHRIRTQVKFACVLLRCIITKNIVCEHGPTQKTKKSNTFFSVLGLLLLMQQDYS